MFSNLAGLARIEMQECKLSIIPSSYAVTCICPDIAKLGSKPWELLIRWEFSEATNATFGKLVLKTSGLLWSVS